VVALEPVWLVRLVLMRSLRYLVETDEDSIRIHQIGSRRWKVIKRSELESMTPLWVAHNLLREFGIFDYEGPKQ